MCISVKIPTPLQKLTANQAEVQLKADEIKDIQGLVESLDKKYPGLKERICDETGKVRRFINIYVNEEDIRFLQQDKTQVADGDNVSIIPAIAGGAKG